jgi:hypothetical protein
MWQRSPSPSPARMLQPLGPLQKRRTKCPFPSVPPDVLKTARPLVDGHQIEDMVARALGQATEGKKRPVDYALFLGRSFRVSWSPDGRLAIPSCQRVGSVRIREADELRRQAEIAAQHGEGLEKEGPTLDWRAEDKRKRRADLETMLQVSIGLQGTN